MSSPKPAYRDGASDFPRRQFSGMSEFAPGKPKRYESTMSEREVMAVEASAAYGVSTPAFVMPRSVAVLSRLLILLTTVTACIVLVFAFVSTREAMNETSETVARFVFESTRAEILAYMDPVISFASKLEASSRAGVWLETSDAKQFGSVVAAEFHESRGKLLAVYAAGRESRQVVKFHQEVSGTWVMQERAYRNASYQERRECAVPEATPISACVMPQTWTAKSYDPTARSWFKAGVNFNISSPEIDTSNGDENAGEVTRYGIIGPELQTANAVGDTSEPVFSLVTTIPTPNVVVRCKFLSRKLSLALTRIDVGHHGEILVVNAETREVIALSSGLGTIDDTITDDPDTPFRTDSTFIDNHLTDEEVENGVNLRIGQTRRIIVRKIPELPTIRVIVIADATDFLPGFVSRVVVSYVFACLSLVLVLLRISVSLYASHKAKKAADSVTAFEYKAEQKTVQDL